MQMNSVQEVSDRIAEIEKMPNPLFQANITVDLKDDINALIKKLEGLRDQAIDKYLLRRHKPKEVNQHE